MVINIRHGVFETNSSSMHSLSMGQDATMEKDTYIHQNITLGSGEYGWGPETLETWLEKADYLAVDAANESEQVLLTDVINSRFPNIVVNFSITGYIDHESCRVVWEEIKSSGNEPDFLYNLLFGTAIIHIDNDNEPYYYDEDDGENDIDWE